MNRILTLMDNTPGPAEGPATTAEHGLSFLVEMDGRRVLFDTGKTGAFLANAAALGADLSDLDAVVLSHGHYDHGGGLRAFAAATGFRGPLWAGSGFFDAKWSDEAGGPRFLGVDFGPPYLDSRGIDLRIPGDGTEKTRSTELFPGIHLLSGFPRTHAEERANPRFLADRDGARGMDDFRDELCLALEVAGGLAVVLGCAHPGLMNMLDAVGAAFGRPVRAVFGGSHLVEADAERIRATVAYLAALDCRTVALGHCTGAEGAAALAAALPAYRPLRVGAAYPL